MAKRTAPEARQTALAERIGEVGTELADCIAEAAAIGQEPPDYLFAHLLDLDQWATDVRTGRVRAFRLVGGTDLDDWLRELREEQPPEDFATPLPAAPTLGEELADVPGFVRLAEQLRPSVIAWQLARLWRVHHRLAVTVAAMLAVAAVLVPFLVAWSVVA